MYTLGTVRDHFKCLLLLEMKLKQGRVQMIRGFVERAKHFLIILLQLKEKQSQECRYVVHPSHWTKEQ